MARTVARLAALCFTLAVAPGAPALAQENVPAAPEPSPASLGPPAWSLPGSGDRRWTVQLGLGPAGAQAPWALFGASGGVAAGPWRVDLGFRVGRTRDATAWPVNPAWTDAFQAYTASRTETQSVLLEASLGRRVGPVEAWGAAGVHFTQLQLQADYDAHRCTDLLCFGGSVLVHDTEWHDGTTVARPALATGVRLPVFDWALLGLEARWLVPGRSEITGWGVSRQVGGLAVAVTLAVRVGDRLHEP